ncbi:hypothetical protein K7G98_15330 [Saccharothrix sp. MB29]|nr:hypothetical protein [Saccharothrix sp. MB29]
MEIRSYPFAEPDDLTLNPAYLDLQRGEPVARVRCRSAATWLATRYDDVKAVLADPRFSRAAALNADVPRTLPNIQTDANILTMDRGPHPAARPWPGRSPPAD